MYQEPKVINKVICPNIDKRFDARKFEPIIRKIVYENLEGKVYDHMYAKDWTSSISRQIHAKVKELALDQYKFVVQVIVGEDRGQGEKCISGCMWDEETDDKASALFNKGTLYCVAVVYAVYTYLYE